MGRRTASSRAFDPASGSLLFSTYAGGPSWNAYRTRARPARPRLDRGRAGADAFVSRIEPERTELLAGEADDLATGLVLDGNGDAWVAGLTASPELPEARFPEHARRRRVPGPPARDDASPQGTCPGTKNFTGAVSLAWETAGNWSGGSLPTAADDVCISGFNVAMGSGTRRSHSLRVESGSLTVSGGTLTLATASEVTGRSPCPRARSTGAGT